MRRAQSVRHHARTSIALASDDLGMLREGTETDEDILRRQLIEKDRECDKLNALVQTLQAQLAVRPPLEEVQALQKEYKNLELILSGTQRENERCMAELERVKQREKLIERKLCDVVGEGWQSTLDIPPSNASLLGGSTLQPLRSAGHQRSHTISSSSVPVTTLSGMYSANNRQSPSPSIRGGKTGRGGYYNHDNGSSASQDQVRDSLLEDGSDSSPVTQRRRRQLRSRRRGSNDDDGDVNVDADEEDDEEEDDDDEDEERQKQQKAMMFSNIEQVKLLVLGMEQRLQTREDELKKNVDRAEREGSRFEVLRRELDSISVA